MEHTSSMGIIPTGSQFLRYDAAKRLFRPARQSKVAGHRVEEEDSALCNIVSRAEID